MKKSFISILLLCIFAILFSRIATGQPFMSEEPDPEVTEHTMDHSEGAFSGLVVIPNSYNYGEWYCTHSVTFGFEIKNNGTTNMSGNVFINGGPPFTCVSGCSFSLSPRQSQLAYIKFEPFYEGPASGTLIAGVGATASLSGEGEELEDEEDPLYPLCEEYP